MPVTNNILTRITFSDLREYMEISFTIGYLGLLFLQSKVDVNKRIETDCFLFFLTFRFALVRVPVQNVVSRICYSYMFLKTIEMNCCLAQSSFMFHKRYPLWTQEIKKLCFVNYKLLIVIFIFPRFLI